MNVWALLLLAVTMAVPCTGYEIYSSQPIKVRRDIVGRWPESGCFAWEFQIDNNGVPYNLKIKKSSRNYGFDLAMYQALQNFRFKIKEGSDVALQYSIQIQYVNGDSFANIAPCCDCTKADQVE